MLAVVADIKHGDLKRGRMAHSGLARFQVDLNSVFFREFLQTFAEAVDWITLCSEADTAAKADPIQLFQKLAVTLLDITEQRVEPVEVGVLTVVVDHHTVDAIQCGLDTLGIALAQTAEFARGVRKVEAGTTDARVKAQADGLAFGIVCITLKLADRVEDDLVAVGDD